MGIMNKCMFKLYVMFISVVGNDDLRDEAGGVLFQQILTK